MLRQLNVKMSDEQALAWARGLLLGVFAMMLVSTSLAIGLEFATYIVFASSLRRRLVAMLRHPVMVGYLLFMFVIVVSLFHGPASWWEALVSIEGWRRALLLPLALAVFDDDASKRLALKALLAVCLVGLVASLVTVTLGISLTEKLPPGIAYRNYTSQGLTFIIAVIACIAAVMKPKVFAGDRILGNRPAMAAFAALLVFDIIFVLSGRSGYVAVVVTAAVTVVLLGAGSWRRKALAGGVAVAVLGLMLAVSHQTRSRVEQGLHEIETVDTATESSSFGQRTVMWRSTIKMIADHPVFGVGTGGFAEAYKSYVPQVTGWQEFLTGDPHNQYMKIQAEQGIFGLAAMLFFIFRVLTAPGAAPYRQLAIAVMLGWCATSVANAHFSTFVEGRLLFFWLGVFLAGPVVLRKAENATI